MDSETAHACYDHSPTDIVYNIDLFGLNYYTFILLNARTMKMNDIRQIPLFAGLSKAETRQIAETLSAREYPAAVLLFEEGEIGNNFWIISEGQIEVIKALGTEEERILSVLGPGDFLGEISLLYQQRARSASARTRSPVKLFEMHPADFENLLSRQPTFAFQILEEMSRRIRHSEATTIRDLHEKNRQLSQAYRELKEAQQHLIQKEKLDHELNIARRIQEQLLPQELPSTPGWVVSAAWQPAYAVSGDFYDFIPIHPDTLAIVIGDASGKGIPAALVMATTRSMLRALVKNETGQNKLSPGRLLKQMNDLLVTDVPGATFITCLFALLDMPSGKLAFANAGHCLPVVCQDGSLIELQATGMPLGLMPGMDYEENKAMLAPGASLVLFSDGVIEAHRPDGSMLGKGGFYTLIKDHSSQPGLIQLLLTSLSQATGKEKEQEDDITLVTVRRIFHDQV
ncbi:MAG: hypothetical protein EHM70_07125 [Chloroflexota bacterium]|nr:MAG: hypothetical protein EHM70_07125 [Chloroflexota bacterium]